MEKRKKKVLVKEKVKVLELPVFQEALGVVGKSEIRVDSQDKVRGKLQYGADMEFPGALCGKVLRSPYPHALIKRIQVEKAKALSGVVGSPDCKRCPRQERDRSRHPRSARHLRRQGEICGRRRRPGGC